MLSMRREAALGTFTYITFYVSRVRCTLHAQELPTDERVSAFVVCLLMESTVDCNAKRHCDYVVYHYFKLWFYLRHINVHRTPANMVLVQCVGVRLEHLHSIFSITFSPIKLIRSMHPSIFPKYYQMSSISLTNWKKMLGNSYTPS